VGRLAPAHEFRIRDTKTLMEHQRQIKKTPNPLNFEFAYEKPLCILYRHKMTPEIDFNSMTNEERFLFLKKLEARKLLLERAGNAKESFLGFVKYIWPEFVEGPHHKIIAEKLDAIRSKKISRLIVNMPPRHTKSEFASFLFPAWMMGCNPKLKIIQTTHTAELAYRFGRKVRNLMNDTEYRSIFEEVELRADSQAAGRWETNHGGEYFAAGVGGSITGRGADLLIIDDPHSEQDALSKTAMENAWEWYTSGPRQRLQPGGSIVVVMTRWSEDDLTERLIEAQAQDPMADQWEIVDFPAITDDGQPQWPNFWKLEQLEAVKASLPAQKWEAQWQQNPTSEETAIIKREWWQLWDKEYMPKLLHVIQSYDTAFSAKDSADYSAITTWGVFRNEMNGKQNIMLMDAHRGKWEFPQLKRVAMEQAKYWEPETIIIEAKATGMPLTHELQLMGLPVVNYTPSRGNDKLVRVNSISPLFEAGQVWAPPFKWAEEVVEECAAFPYGKHDDYVDSVTQALMRYRQFGALIHPDDEEIEYRPRRKIKYYGN